MGSYLEAKLRRSGWRASAYIKSPKARKDGRWIGEPVSHTDSTSLVLFLSMADASGLCTLILKPVKWK